MQWESPFTQPLLAAITSHKSTTKRVWAWDNIFLVHAMGVPICSAFTCCHNQLQSTAKRVCPIAHAIIIYCCVMYFMSVNFFHNGNTFRSSRCWESAFQNIAISMCLTISYSLYIYKLYFKYQINWYNNKYLKLQGLVKPSIFCIFDS